jgi:serine/threonine protein kinase/Flp pilus assembly protein TadD
MNQTAERAKSLFLAALEIADAPQRQAFLEAECAGDRNLQREVDELLRHFERVGSFMESPALELNTTVEEGTSKQPGTVIGPYKLLEQIGEGGMGLVFVAEQQQPVKRRVALKVIKPGMDTRQVIARFEAERQALAMMDHPHIAKVHDGGTTPEGRPYFVMELVKGLPITDYCDQQRRSTRQRLELFLDVCRAVQHAHQKGIIHRDLKPSNVLVEIHDVRPVVKVIDFGIAKATSGQLTDKTLYTEGAQLVGTPLYMSPEQAGLSSLDVDTRSDVYSLGVLLYELLTGTTPFESETLKRAGYDEMRRIIREDEPPKPSARLSTMQQAHLSTVAERRGLEPHKLSQQVRGELDWVVMKALEKDRNRRYESASALADDVQRYLADEPLLASPPSTLYRLKKLARRHRLALTAMSIAVLVLLLTVVGLAVGLVAVERERGRTAAEQDRTRAALEAESRRRQQARRALDAVSSAVINDLLAKQKELLPEHRAFLERTLAWYEEFAADTGEEEDVREGVAGAHLDIGRILERLGQSAAAERAFRKSIERYQQLAADFPATPEYRKLLARTYHNLALLDQEEGRAPEADAAFREAIVLQSQLVAEFPAVAEYRADMAASQGDLARLLWETRRLREGEVAFREVIALESQLAADFPAVPRYRKGLAMSLSNFANFLRRIDRVQEAEKFHRKALDLRMQLAAASPTDPTYRQDLAASHGNLARVLFETGRPQEGEAAWREALALLKQLAADFPAVPEYRKHLAMTHNNLGICLWEAGRVQEAEAAYREAVALRSQLAADFPAVLAYRDNLAASYNNLALLLRQGRAREAEAAQREAVALWKRLAAESPAVPEFRYNLAASSTNLGDLLKEMDRVQEAEAAYREAVALRSQLTADFPAVRGYRSGLARAHNSLGILLMETGRVQEAEASYRKALALKKSLATDFPSVPEYRTQLVTNYSDLGTLLGQTGRGREAEAAFHEALDIGQQLATEFPAVRAYREDLAAAHTGLGNLLWEMGRAREAEAAFRKALVLKSELAAASPGNHSFQNALGWFLATCPAPTLRDPVRAVTLARKAVELQPRSPSYHNTLGIAHFRAGEWKPAAAALEKAIELCEYDPKPESAFFLAMVRSQLGEKEKAREWYTKAVAWMEKNRPKDEELKRCRAEAAELLGIPNPQPAKEKPATKP